MLNLIKLEIKKYKLSKYIITAIISIIGIMAFITMFAFTGLADPSGEMETYTNALWIINILVTGTFIIFSSVLTSKIVIGEYKNRTILMMFSYPIDRKKIMGAKLFISVVWTIIGIIIGNILCTAYLVILDSIIDVVAGSFSMYYFSGVLLFGSAIMSGILSLIPFAFGMIKKSVPTTIVSAILIVVLMPQIIGRDRELISILIKLAIITIVTAVIVINALRKQIDNIDNIDIE